MAEQGRLTKHGRAMRRLLAEQQRSGLTLAEFARRRGVRAGTLSWWRHRLGTEQRWAKSRRRPSSKAGRFLEITPASVVPAEARSAAWFEIVLGDGTLVRVPGRFGDEELRRLRWRVRRC